VTVPDIARRVRDATPSIGPVRLVCVDGPAGSGKTTLAAALADALSGPQGAAPVVHGDDLYEGWAVVADAPDRVAAFDVLADRVTAWLLDPWSRGAVALQPVRDWSADQWGEPVAVPAADVVVLEGVGMAARRLRAHAALVVWVEVDAATGIERVVARDGEAMRAEIESWQRDEARWHALDGTRDAADLRLRGD
jgi:uridine kinase